MTRERLPDRRHCATVRVPVTLDGGKEINLLVTIGFADVGMTIPREVFCADFKAGTAIQSVMMDGCVLLSRLLQHGVPPEELSGTLCQPPSLLGAIAAAVVQETISNIEWAVEKDGGPIND